MRQGRAWRGSHCPPPRAWLSFLAFQFWDREGWVPDRSLGYQPPCPRGLVRVPVTPAELVPHRRGESGRAGGDSCTGAVTTSPLQSNDAPADVGSPTGV